jgi:hypothetical protein
MAPTDFSPVINMSRTSRRCASPRALKTSDVVEDLATGSTLYTVIGICQGDAIAMTRPKID